jgi:phage tail-like protein
MKRNVHLHVQVAMASAMFAGAVLSGCLSEMADPNAAATDPTAEAVTETQGAATIAPRAGVAAHYALELDGALVGWLDSATGGRATAEVLVEKLGTDNVARKHLGPVKYEDIKVTCGAGMSAKFWEWLQDVFDRKPSRRSGAIVAADFNFKELTRTTFYDALVTEIGMPALDASSKDAARLSVTFSPRTTKLTRGDGSAHLVAPTPGRQRRWQARNFRLTVDGLDTTGVSSVGAFVVKQGIIEFRDGSQREPRKEPGSLEIPNLVVTVSEKTAEPWYQWHEDFVIQGDNAPAKEKTGSLQYLSQDLKEALFTLDFHGLGIFKLEPDDSDGDGSGDTPAKEKAEMYCQDAVFSVKPKP